MENCRRVEFVPENEGDELSLLDILIILAEQKRLVASVVILFTLAGVVFTFFFMKPKYLSEVQMMTVSSSMVDKNSFSVQIPGDMIGGIVTSNYMMDAVIEEFALMQKNGKTLSKKKARTELTKDIKVVSNKNGLVTLKVETYDPELSMRIASFIYEKTDEALQQVGVSATVENRDALLEKTIKEKLQEIETMTEPQDDASRTASALELYTIISQYGENQKIKNVNPKVLQLISPPSTPDEKEPQGRAKIIALSMLLGFFCAVTLAFMRHFWIALEDHPETAEKKVLLKKLLGSKTA